MNYNYYHETRKRERDKTIKYAEAIIRRISWDIDRFGIITATLNFMDPIAIEDGKCTVKSLKHIQAGQLDYYGLGIGATIKVPTHISRGCVITNYMEKKSKSDIKTTPQICPFCESKIEGISSTYRGTISCSNPKCDERNYKTLAFFVTQLGTSSLKSNTLEDLECKSVSDVLSLTDEKLIALKKYKGKKATRKKILDALTKARDMSARKILLSCSIKDLHHRQIDKLLGVFTINELITKCKQKPAALDNIQGLNYGTGKRIGEAINARSEFLISLQEQGFKNFDYITDD